MCWPHVVAHADDFGLGYDLIRDDGTDENRRGALNFIGAGVSCADDSANNETECTISAGSGDIESVGDCTTGACFDGSSGTTLTSTTSEILDLATDATLIFQRNTAGTVVFAGKDNAGAADTTYDTTLTGKINIGSTDVDDVTIFTAAEFLINSTTGFDLSYTPSLGVLIFGDGTFGCSGASLCMGDDSLGTLMIFSTDDSAGVMTQVYAGTSAAPTTVGANVQLGFLETEGYNASSASFTRAGSLYFVTDGEWATAGDTTDSPGKFEVWTTPDGTSTLVLRLTIDADGDWHLGDGTGVKLVSDGDGAIELTGESTGSDECLALNLDDTSNDVVYSNCASSTGVTDVSLSSLDLDLEGTGPDIQWIVTGGSTFHLGAEPSEIFLSRSSGTPAHYFNAYASDDHITLGATGNISYIKLQTDSTGDSEVQLPASSVGNSEVVGGLSKCASVENLAAADDNMLLGSMPVAVTVTGVWCHCSGTCSTPATVALEDDAGNAMTGTATCDTGGGVATPATITAGGALSAYEGLRFDTTNTPSPDGSDEYAICFGF